VSRLMSVSLTEQAVVDRSKTVTRRLGWRFLKPGDRLTLCRKVQGRRRVGGHSHGHLEPLIRLAEVEVVSVDRRPLHHIDTADVTREGFPGWDPDRFIRFFCDHMACQPDTEVTRIGWRYLDDEAVHHA
jgi:hypothetical protein